MIDRSHVERELEAVRAQGREAQAMIQQAANVVQQAIGAEKAFNSVLKLIDEANAVRVDAPTKRAKGAEK
ncbi:hypothetical protein GCM10023067_04710 [Aminobacter aganoensis]